MSITINDQPMISVAQIGDSPSAANSIKSHQSFGIFLTLIGLVFVIPKVNSYYNQYVSEKKNSKYIERTRIENIFVFAGILFLVYGIKEIFFKNKFF